MFNRVKKHRSQFPEYFIDSRLEIKRCDYIEGLGVFAKEKIRAYELVESAPALVFCDSILYDWLELSGARHIIHDYIFSWPNGLAAMPLGFGGLYNHSSKPNIIFSANKKLESIEFTAKTDIEPGDELFVKYNHESKLWFEPKNKKKYP